jgi:hypothetical protein
VYYEVGKFETFSVELRTNKDRRLALDPLNGDLTFQQSGNVKFTLEKTKYRNKYTVFTESTKAYNLTDAYNVTLLIRSETLQKAKLQFIIVPDIPDPTKTLLVNSSFDQIPNNLRNV